MQVIIVRACLTWLGLAILAFINGALREFVIKIALGIKDPLANQLSCLTGITIWTAFVFLVWNQTKIQRTKEALFVGTGWFIATVIFETFIVNQNLTLSEIFHTYNILDGEFWGLVVLWIWLMPLVIHSLKRAKPKSA